MQASVEYRSLKPFGYPHFRVGNDGSIWSRLSRSPCGGLREWHQLFPTDAAGRSLVNLKNIDGKRGTRNVAHLVLFAFVGPCPEGMECCHYDGDHMNNCLGNVRWDTHLGNEADKKRHGTGNVGVRNRSAKLNEDQVREIRRLYATGDYSFSQLAKMYGLAIMTVHPLVRRRTWKHVV